MENGGINFFFFALTISGFGQDYRKKQVNVCVQGMILKEKQPPTRFSAHKSNEEGDTCALVCGGAPGAPLVGREAAPRMGRRQRPVTAGTTETRSMDTPPRVVGGIG